MTGSVSYGNHWKQPQIGKLELHPLDKEWAQMSSTRHRFFFFEKHLCWQSNIHITYIMWVIFFKNETAWIQEASTLHCVEEMPTASSFAIFLVIHLQAKLALGGDRCKWGLVHACSRCSTLKWDNTFQGPSNPCNVRFGITYRLRPIRRWNNIIIHANGNIGVIFTSSS